MTALPHQFPKSVARANSLDRHCAGWLRSLCALLTHKWAKQFPVPLEIALVDCAAAPARELLSQLPSEGIAYNVSLGDQFPTLMVWPKPLALALAGCLLGDPAQELPVGRDLTVVEESVFELFLKDYLLPSFPESWTGLTPLKPMVGSKDPNPQWTRLFVLDDPLVATRFGLKGSWGEQQWLWLAPCKNLLDNLAPGAGAEHAVEAATAKRRLDALVRELPVAITVTLGTVELALAELAQLQPGDVIVLNQRINQPLKALVAGEKPMTGWAGRVGSNQAFQIETIAE